MIGAIELKLNGHAGFLYHHTCDEVPVPLMNDIRIADSISKNRYIYLQQANMASRLLVWFENHIDELNDKLRELSMQVTYRKKMANYYDSQGRLSQYPTKRPMRVIALTKIADCFEFGRKYTEKEVNAIIKQNISFSDIELVRREMFQLKLIGRLRDGSAYWRE